MRLDLIVGRTRRQLNREITRADGRLFPWLEKGPGLPSGPSRVKRPEPRNYRYRDFKVPKVVSSTLTGQAGRPSARASSLKAPKL